MKNQTKGLGLLFGALLVVGLALSGCGSSSPASSGAAPAAPTTPTGVAVAPGASAGSIIISWNAVPVATSYNFYYATAPGVTKASAKLSAAAPANNTGPLQVTATCTSGLTYYGAMTAANANGESALSAPEVSAVCP